MFRFASYLTLFILMAAGLSAQTVSTLVPGPSTFNDGLTIDKNGNIYAAMFLGSAVTKITPEGQTSTFATGIQSPNGLTFGPDGYLYVPSPPANKIHRVSLEGVSEEYMSIPHPGDLFFAKNGLMYVCNYDQSIIYTVDTAKNVTTVFNGSPLNGPISVRQDSAGTLYIGNFNDGKVFRVDSGNVLTQIGDLPGWLGFMIIIDNYIYATAYQNHLIYKVALDGSGQSVFAGTGSRGQATGPLLQSSFNNPNGIIATPGGDTIYISDYTARSLRRITGVRTPTSVTEELGAPQNFSLEQNYPNPFNPETTIGFTLEKSGYVLLEVFTMLGEKVTRLQDCFMEAGKQSLRFSAANLPAGIYYYRLTHQGTTQTKKLTLLK